MNVEGPVDFLALVWGDWPVGECVLRAPSFRAFLALGGEEPVEDEVVVYEVVVDIIVVGVEKLGVIVAEVMTVAWSTSRLPLELAVLTVSGVIDTGAPSSRVSSS